MMVKLSSRERFAPARKAPASSHIAVMRGSASLALNVFSIAMIFSPHLGNMLAHGSHHVLRGLANARAKAKGQCSLRSAHVIHVAQAAIGVCVLVWLATMRFLESNGTLEIERKEHA